MQIKNEKESREILDSNSLEAVTALGKDDKQKLNLLNMCSKKYFNLNLLMHTIEYQHSLMNKISKQNTDVATGTTRADLNDRIEKLLMNISHLQDCATKKFDEFNKRLDGKLKIDKKIS